MLTWQELAHTQMNVFADTQNDQGQRDSKVYKSAHELYTVKFPVGQGIKIRLKHSKTCSWLAVSTWVGKLIHWHLAVLLRARSNTILTSAPILCKGVQTFKIHCSRECTILARKQQHRNWAESVEVIHWSCRNINVISAAAAAVARD